MLIVVGWLDVLSFESAADSEKLTCISVSSEVDCVTTNEISVDVSSELEVHLSTVEIMVVTAGEIVVVSWSTVERRAVVSWSIV